MFADGVSSQEIVGYQTIPLKAGFNMITPTFKSTGATDATYDIQDIKISNADGDFGQGAESIQVIDGTGNVSAMYTWWSKDVTGLDKDAWCNDDLKEVTIPLKQGQAFLLYTESDGVAVVSGCVAEGGFDMTLANGFNGIGNATPIASDIQKIVIKDADGTYGQGAESVQIIGTDGNVSAMYTWWSKDITGLDKDAWCDDDLKEVKLSIEPGVGFLLYTEGEGIVSLPTAL